MATLHHRMPVILDEKDWPMWTGEEPGGSKLKQFLLRSGEKDLKAWPVSKAVGNVKNQGRELAEPIELAPRVPPPAEEIAAMTDQEQHDLFGTRFARKFKLRH